MKSVRKTCPLGSECQIETAEEIVRCHWYMQVRGVNPQTGESVDEWGCAIAFMPILQIEGSQQTRQAGAAIESMRNETIRRQDAALQLVKNNAPAITNS